MNVYHKEVYWPKKVCNELPTGEFSIKYSRHALDEMNDRNGKIPEFEFLMFMPENFVESYYPDELPAKWTYRFSLDNTNDLVAVVVRDGFYMKVITQWLNKKTDNHKTLKRWLYVQN